MTIATSFCGRGKGRSPFPFAKPTGKATGLTWLLPVSFLLFFLPAAPAQHNLVLYNMRQVPQAHLLNPGQMPLLKGYFGFPALSGIRVGGGQHGLHL